LSGEQRLGIAEKALASRLCLFAAAGSALDDILETIKPQVIVELICRQLDAGSSARITDDGGGSSASAHEAGRSMPSAPLMASSRPASRMKNETMPFEKRGTASPMKS
jgi:hypothetical protein